MDIILALATMFVIFIIPTAIVCGLVAAPDKSRVPARSAVAPTPEVAEEHAAH
jgi:hypothetical protein